MSDLSDFVVSDRENRLYEIFKERLMDELKIVGYRLVQRSEDSPYRVTQVYDDVTILPDGRKIPT